MTHLFSRFERPLPEILQEDLEELTTWDNNAFLTWVYAGGAGTEASRWFTVRLTSDGARFYFQLEFWIPEWMNARNVEAILPASRSVTECRAGEWARVDLELQYWSALKASAPRVARTCARLICELWGPTETDQVLVLAMNYQDVRLPTPFSELPGYQR